MSSTETRSKGKNILERVLSVFAPVYRGEATTALLMMVNVFVLLTAYYLIKPVREALILGGAGAEIKSYAGAGQAMLFLVLVPLYSVFASRTNRVRLINGVTAFFISNLIIFQHHRDADIHQRHERNAGLRYMPEIHPMFQPSTHLRSVLVLEPVI